MTIYFNVYNLIKAFEETIKIFFFKSTVLERRALLVHTAPMKLLNLHKQFLH